MKMELSQIFNTNMNISFQNLWAFGHMDVDNGNKRILNFLLLDLVLH